MAAKTICPKCKAVIPLADINVAADTALCRKCGSAWNFGELIEEKDLQVDLDHPPRGVWYHEQASGFELGVTTRSPVAFFLVPFVCVWSGFALGGIYGTQIYSGKFNLLLSLFGIPFILGTLLFGGLALMLTFGKMVVTKDHDQGSFFKGIGPLGWRQRFNWSGVTTIKRTGKRSAKGNPYEVIEFKGDKPFHFGQGLSDARFDFMLAVLQQKFREGGN